MAANRYTDKQIVDLAKVTSMSNRRGRPPLDDRAALRRVAEHLVDTDQQGSPCSVRAAILRTSGQVVGNSPDAVLWRLQRKWRREGQALLAEAKRRRGEQRWLKAAFFAETGTIGSQVHDLAQALEQGALPFQQALRRIEEHVRAVQRQHEATERQLEEFARPCRDLESSMRELMRPNDALERVWRFEGQIRAGLEDAMRRSRAFDEGMRTARRRAIRGNG